jgi:16S rRNA (uracil1498-N3)-methyltransferase
MSRGPLRVPVDVVAPGPCTLAADTASYVSRVHRLGPGDRLVVFDPERGVEADAEITEATKRAVTVRVGAPRPAAQQARRAVTLIQGVGKGDKMDGIVRDATELGATRIVPALCTRSVARPDEARSARWRRIAVEAARQCGRGDAPVIAAPMGFAEAVREAREGVRLCLDPRAEVGLGAALAEMGEGALVMAVGPEGGFTDEELAAADEAGLTRVTLGGLVLRTETVCAAVLGAVLAFGQVHGTRAG